MKQLIRLHCCCSDSLTPYSPAVQNNRLLYSLSCCSVLNSSCHSPLPATDSYNSANYTGCHTLNSSSPSPLFCCCDTDSYSYIPGTTPRSLRSLYSLSRFSVLNSSSPSPILCRCTTVNYRRHIKKLSVAAITTVRSHFGFGKFY